MSNLDGNKPGTKNITGDVNVQVAPTPNITVGNTTTLEPGQSATYTFYAYNNGDRIECA